MSTENWPACWWQWSWSVGRSSYQDRSWRRMCSSRSVTWFLVSQVQSPLQEDCIHFDRSSNPSRSEKCSKKKRNIYIFSQGFCKIIQKEINVHVLSVLAFRLTWYVMVEKVYIRATCWSDLGNFLLPLHGMLVHRRATPAPPPLYTWCRDRSTVRVQCLVQEHNIVLCKGFNLNPTNRKSIARASP